MGTPTFAQVKKFTEGLGGKILYAYDQGLDHRALAGGSLTSEGWCAAMSAFWIQKNAKGENFWTWMGADKKAAPGFSTFQNASLTPVNPLRRVMAIQEQVKVQYKDLVSERAKSDYWAPIVEATTDVRRNRSRDAQVGKAPGSAVDIASKIGGIVCNGTGYRYIVFVMQNSKGQQFGHAVAAHIAGNGVVRYMDPNFGEHELPSQAAYATFITKFFTARPYKTAFIIRSSGLTG
jgi:hypothetical protein